MRIMTQADGWVRNVGLRWVRNQFHHQQTLIDTRSMLSDSVHSQGGCRWLPSEQQYTMDPEVVSERESMARVDAGFIS